MRPTRHHLTVVTADIHVGMVCDGSTQVPSGLRVRLLGTVKGDLVVEAGAKVEVFGEIRGDIHADGRVNIYDGARIGGRLLGEGVRDRRTVAVPLRAQFLN